MKNENETKHSPTPWRVYNEYEIEDANENMVLFSTIGWYECGDITRKDVEQAKADLAFILEAVNAHERLVAENARLRDAALYTINLLLLRGDGKCDCLLTWDEFNSAVLKLRAALREEASND